jgi:hypothetical protein
MTDALCEFDFGLEGRIRYAAARRGYWVMTTRGHENDRRRKAGLGQYLLIDTHTNAVALPVATLDEIAAFLKAQPGRKHLH